MHVDALHVDAVEALTLLRLDVDEACNSVSESVEAACNAVPEGTAADRSVMGWGLAQRCAAVRLTS